MRQDRNKLEEAVLQMLLKKLSLPGPLGTLLQKFSERPGKHLRSRLFLACVTEEVLTENMLRIPLGIELLHLASLVHDDLIDGSKLRRGGDSLWMSQGVPVALLCGDYLFAEAFLEFSASDIPSAAPMMRTLVQGMVRAELDQNRYTFCWKLPLSSYRRRALLKTARFFGVSAALGGFCGRRPSDEIRSLYRYGIALGMAYQLVDDLEDFIDGEDLKQGLFSMPLLELAKKDAAGEKILERIGREHRIRTGDWKQLRERLIVTNGYDSTIDKIRDYLCQAERLALKFHSSSQRSLNDYYRTFRSTLITKDVLENRQLMKKRWMDWR